ncbi:MAG: hypothetical protein GC145_17605, partial [Caulobacter sp.]|nr:hypothetical protein [Caulobacter sp.]
YQSIAQDGADALVTLASGVTMRLSGVTASTVTDASFIGLPPPPPPPPGGGEPQPPAGYNAIVGTAAVETLVGGAGSDAISGLDGGDTLYGRTGDDWLSGGAGVDKLFGENGSDVLYGGGGSDYLYGGGGADTFVYYQTSDSTSAERDYIRDFNAADGDILDVSLVDADVNTAGDQAFVQVASFTGVAGQMTVSTVGSVSTVSFDTNGDSNADMVITVIGTLGSAWHL